MKKMRKFTKSKIVEKLWQAISLLEGDQEVRQFLEDLLYPSEVSMLGQRLLIATMIRRGLDYREIIAKTGASVSTIHRVSEVLHRGTAGYELALTYLEQRKERGIYWRKEYNLDPTERYIRRRLARGK